MAPSGAMVHAATFSPVVYQLRVTLEYIDPPIWRRLHVPGRFTLTQLHDVIQVAMGWEDDHLHEFEIDGVRYGPPRSGPPSPFRTTERDERKARLAGVVHQIGAVFGYTYNFGDSWQHVIEIEDVADSDADTRRAMCVAGERACPPEDCGGVPGYYHLLEAADNPDDEFTDRFGRRFDPERFDLDVVNRRLGHVLR
ncbi:MAG: plasmid pRiA4b ORF-3 family protein [Pseudonocardiaceae bacterium]